MSSEQADGEDAALLAKLIAMSDADVDAELAALGIDVDAFNARAEAFAKGLAVAPKVTAP